jgi:Zn-dependent protease with chaperone function
MKYLILCLWLLSPFAVRSQGIVDVLQRSQQTRLNQRAPADPSSPESARVRASFARLLALAPQEGAVELVLVGGNLYAEALFGRRSVAASEAVGALPEGERLLMLAHELGHLSLGHWGAMSNMYLRLIPGEVRPQTTDPVAAQLAEQGQALSHRHEFEADAYGFTLVYKLGFGVDNAFGLLTRQGVQSDAATHPGTRRRLAQLRALDIRIGRATQDSNESEAVAAQPGRDLH